jgi:hypothetical protein
MAEANIQGSFSKADKSSPAHLPAPYFMFSVSHYVLIFSPLIERKQGLEENRGARNFVISSDPRKYRGPH